jgi:hypothetical protein
MLSLLPVLAEKEMGDFIRKFFGRQDGLIIGYSLK